MRRTILCMLLACGVLACSSAAWAEPAGDRAQLLEIAERLLEEAERQHSVNHRMDTTIGTLKTLIADLRSNELFREGKGPQLDRAAGTLDGLSDKHVPAAAKYLEDARKRIQARHPNVAAADTEIKIIVKRLAELWAKTGERAADARLSELRVIIQKELKVKARTTQWGRQLFQDPEKADEQRQPLAGDQKQVNQLLKQFAEHAREDVAKADDEVRKEMLKQVVKALDDLRPDKKLDRAARDIEARKPVAAVLQQAKAIEDLKAIEKLFQQEEDLFAQRLRDKREKIEDMLKRQKELREKTEQTPKKDFPEKKREMQVEQRKLTNELSELNKEQRTEEPESKTRRPLEEAEKDMTKAEKAMQEDKKDETAQKQKEAEEHLAEALEKLDEEIAEAEQDQLADESQDELADELEAMKDKIDELREKQEQLADETREAEPKKLPELKPRQQELARQSEQVKGEVPLAEQELDEAARHMADAAGELQKQDQAEAGKAQQNALRALEKAQQKVSEAQQQLQELQQLAQQQQEIQEATEAAEGEEELGEQAEPQGELAENAEQNPHAARAARHMRRATQHLQQGQQPQAVQQQQQAVQALQQAQQQVARTVRRVRQARTTDPNERGLHEFGKTTPGGAKPVKDMAKWSAMSDRKRNTLYQKYARELPLEYRQLLEDYYESLSK